MKKSPQKQPSTAAQAPLCGVFTKRQAVVSISQGCRHLHSSVLGQRDPAAKVTQEALTTNSIPTYAWEPTQDLSPIMLTKSADRAQVIDQIIVGGNLEKKRFIREKVTSVLEELLTNAIYHAYHTASGAEKYARRDEVTLQKTEVLAVRYQTFSNGVYLSVTDQGGNLLFDDVARSLWRCYETSAQIENKEGGAGLGTYMVFEAVTHFKIVATPGKGATVAVWIADQRSFDPDTFSFNFFERRHSK
jgi:anti-sigma regulatory factor (Ser/Thr protein kinase)